MKVSELCQHLKSLQAINIQMRRWRVYCTLVKGCFLFLAWNSLAPFSVSLVSEKHRLNLSFHHRRHHSHAVLMKMSLIKIKERKWNLSVLTNSDMKEEENNLSSLWVQSTRFMFEYTRLWELWFMYSQTVMLKRPFNSREKYRKSMWRWQRQVLWDIYVITKRGHNHQRGRHWTLPLLKVSKEHYHAICWDTLPESKVRDNDQRVIQVLSSTNEKWSNCVVCREAWTKPDKKAWLVIRDEIRELQSSLLVSLSWSRREIH